MTEQRIRILRRKLQEARYAAICRNPDFASLLLEMRYFADKDVVRMSTNGSCIFVNPNWLQGISISSLEFMLAHQQMHIRLGHIDRSRLFAGERFHLACDIVANSHLRDLGYTEEQLPGVGKIYHETFYPITEGKALTAEQAFRRVPFDPASLKDKKAVRYLIDSESFWGRTEAEGESGLLLLSPEDKDPDDLRLDAVLHSTEKPREKGRLKRHPEEIKGNPGAETDGSVNREKPGTGPGGDEQKANLHKLRRLKAQDEQTEAMEMQERFWLRPNDPRIDWRRLLDSFLQEQLSDYSFLPPDRRLDGSDFYLPDFNETEWSPQLIVFAVDTSGSVDEGTLSRVFSEICGAVEQLDGKLSGCLLFFDTRVYTPIPFTDVRELENMIPVGGGGTDLSCPFRYLAFSEMKPANLVIFTDGQGTFPDERAAGDMPVLWLLTREDVQVPWGRCAWLS